MREIDLDKLDNEEAAGIYVIQDNCGAFYIGESGVIIHRLGRHYSSLCLQTHSLVLPCRFFIIEEMPNSTPEQRRKREKTYRTMLKESGVPVYMSCKRGTTQGYNLSHIAGM